MVRTPSFPLCLLVSAVAHGLLAAALMSVYVTPPRLMGGGQDAGIGVSYIPGDGFGDGAAADSPPAGGTVGDAQARQEDQARASARIEDMTVDALPRKRIQWAKDRPAPPSSLVAEDRASAAQASAAPGVGSLGAGQGGSAGIAPGGGGQGLGSGGYGGGAGGGLMRALVVQGPKPPYPLPARQAGFEGKVVLDILVGKEGVVKKADVVESSGRQDCDRAALSTILEKWRFEPARVNGMPVDWPERVLVRYDLR